MNLTIIFVELLLAGIGALVWAVPAGLLLTGIEPAALVQPVNKTFDAGALEGAAVAARVAKPFSGFRPCGVLGVVALWHRDDPPFLIASIAARKMRRLDFLRAQEESGTICHLGGDGGVRGGSKTEG